MYDWYKLFNREEFLATGLVSQEITVILASVGAKTFLITKGNLVSVTVDDVMLSIGLVSDNPFEFGDRALLIDVNFDVWYGIPVA